MDPIAPYVAGAAFWIFIGSVCIATGAVAERLDLDAALGALPSAVRLCVVLAYSEGMSHSEISDTTAMPLGTVKSHITRGASRLRELLQAYGDRHDR